MKKTIDYTGAHNSIYSCLHADDFMDRIYEFAQDLFQKECAKINEEFFVIRQDGTICEPEDNEQWYDDEFEDFFKHTCRRIVDVLLPAGYSEDSTQVYRLMENAVHLSADMYSKLESYSEDMRDKAAFIIAWAKEMEHRLGGKDEDEGEYDYVEELEKIETEIQQEIDRIVHED